MSLLYHCACCDEAEEKQGRKFKACAVCKVVRYCSKECQKRHWKMHKVGCRVPSFRFSRECIASIGGIVHGAKDKTSLCLAASLTPDPDNLTPEFMESLRFSGETELYVEKICVIAACMAVTVTEETLPNCLDVFRPDYVPFGITDEEVARIRAQPHVVPYLTLYMNFLLIALIEEQEKCESEEKE